MSSDSVCNGIARKRFFLLSALAVTLALSCSSDPEGPVTKKLVDDGTYGVRVGALYRAVIPVHAFDVSVPLGVGTSRLLTLGRLRDIEYRAILVKFDFTVAAKDAGKTVAWARFRFPVKVATPTDFKIPVTIHELVSSFNETDTIAAVPPFDPVAVRDSLGGTVDTLSINGVEFTIDAGTVSHWLGGDKGQNGFAIIWAARPDSSGSLELNARELGSDPLAVRVHFTDGTSASYGAAKDYTVAVFTGTGLNCVGGIAKRIVFGFSLDSIRERAMIQASFLVLNVRGDEGLGATSGELALGLTDLFAYYLYAPNSTDTASADFRLGTGVDRSSFDPVVSQTIRLPLRGYTQDVVKGARVNRGLVLQSNLETGRIQRASFDPSGPNAPRIEVIYSLPATFTGGK